MRVIERAIVLVFGAPLGAEAAWAARAVAGPGGASTAVLEPGVMTRALLSLWTAGDEGPARDECLYVGEAGRVMSRRELLEGPWAGEAGAQR